MKKYNAAVIGARGHVGSELLPLLFGHPHVDTACVSSRSHHGERISGHVPAYQDDQMCYQHITSENIAELTPNIDVFFLALPDRISSDYVRAILSDRLKSTPVIIDLSSDHRLDDHWVYGLPEVNRDKISQSRLVANPGCYATAMMLALLPLQLMLIEPPCAFGVSGFSGAGKKPSDKNNPARLRDNILPYQLSGHGHETEVSYQLGTKVRFMPHVAPHFRGLSVTVNATVNRPISKDELLDMYSTYYQNEPLVDICVGIPEVAQVAGHVGAKLGGFFVEQCLDLPLSNIRFVCVIDNLLKGAASQAIQNMNIALQLPELCGLNPVEGGDI